MPTRAARPRLRIASLSLSLDALQSAPFNVGSGDGSTVSARATIAADEQAIYAGLTASSQPGAPSTLLAAGHADLATITPVVRSLERIAEQGLAVSVVEHPDLLPALQVRLSRSAAALARVLAKIGGTDADAAQAASDQSKLGASGAMILLLVAFAIFYFRSLAARAVVERTARDRGDLLGVSRVEARTDALTTLGNRRALAGDLARIFAPGAAPGEHLLVMFDLDGFKQYNDTFGHAAGDALLHRLGGRLAVVAEHDGHAYRMGGDEFCLLADVTVAAAPKLLREATAALQDIGEGWHVDCSRGTAWIPSEASSESEALRLVDTRMYANKAGRASASGQVTNALLQVITEQNVVLDDHVERVAELAGALAELHGVPDYEVRRIQLAARLHDVGKTAIPATILDKPGPLDELEWELINRHPAIGARIVMAAPALASTAELIRSSHERVDGLGYPDQLSGEDIPLGSRIIAVCDAFDAMTSDRLYRRAISVDAALEQLRENSGTQFDRHLVELFCSATDLHNSSSATPQMFLVRSGALAG